jgi:hypothetical protein
MQFFMTLLRRSIFPLILRASRDQSRRLPFLYISREVTSRGSPDAVGDRNESYFGLRLSL